MGSFNLADYEPVEDRLAKWWEQHPDGRIDTRLLAHDDQSFIVGAWLYRTGERDACATGLAREVVTDRGVNSTSALENCETSAIGRALANAGFAAKGKRPSREEMARTTQTPPPAPPEGWASHEDALAGYSQLRELTNRFTDSQKAEYAAHRESLPNREFPYTRNMFVQLFDFAYRLADETKADS